MSKSRLEDIAKIGYIYHPRTAEEVKALIIHAKEKNIPVRTAGSAHSPAVAIYDVECKEQIKIVLDGELRKIKSFQPDESKEFATVSVGAGCYLGVNPRDTSVNPLVSKSNLKNSFTHQLDEAGYALPTLGGISHQSIAGFLQTSSSGGSTRHGIADTIEAIEFIDGTGQLRQAKRGDDLFNAAVVSMGLMGIVTNVTFKVPKKYCVQGIEVNREFTDSLLAPDADDKTQYSKLKTALFGNKDTPAKEYIHINWLAQKYVNRTMEWTGSAVPPVKDSEIKPYEHALHGPLTSALAAAVLKIGDMIDRHAIDNDTALHFKANLLKQFADPKDQQEFVDVWYKTLPIDDQAPVDDAIKTEFSELWFPPEKLNEVMTKMQALLAENEKASGNFIIEFYCAKESPFWMSPAYGHDAFRVDLYWWDHNKGNADEYFSLFWNALLDIPGARLHWGKHLPIPGKKYGDRSYSSEDLYSNYPKFNEWAKLREEMDPQQLFVTPYWRQVLNIPAPEKTLTAGISAEKKPSPGILAWLFPSISCAPLSEEKTAAPTFKR